MGSSRTLTLRARQDPALRHALVAGSLDLLLHELNKLRSKSTDAGRTRQIREGVELAVRLAHVLQRSASAPSGTTRAA